MEMELTAAWRLTWGKGSTLLASPNNVGSFGLPKTVRLTEHQADQQEEEEGSHCERG